jgi:transcriptional/translational regulatory protein YebC/TACO1
MSGHNKFSQIKRQKEKTDAQKAKVFSKYSKLIYLEAKKVSGNMSAPNLISIIEKAKKENVSKDVIERAVKKSKEVGGDAFEKIIYESYGPGGSAIMIEALTSNRNKAAQEIKHILSENGCALAVQGSASWAFNKNPDGGWTANTTVELFDEDIQKLEKLTDELEANDEVQDVFTNAE